MVHWLKQQVLKKRELRLKTGKNRRQLFFFISAWIPLFLLSGCGLSKTQIGDVRFHDDGRAKPIVAFVPIIDRSGSEIGWSLSEEWTDLLKNRLFKRNRFYISVPNGMSEFSFSPSRRPCPFSSDVGWIQEAFESYEYVIFIEIVEYDIHLKEKGKSLLQKISPSRELSMTARIHIFDLRGEKPEIILQEFIHKNYSIPKPSSIEASNPGRWKKWTHHVSPIGLSHAQFCKEISKRIEEYIALSKSR